MQQVVLRHKLPIAQYTVLTQMANEMLHYPTPGEVFCYAFHVGFAIPGDAKTLFERQHQEVPVIIDRADWNAGATHDTFVCKMCDVRGNIF